MFFMIFQFWGAYYNVVVVFFFLTRHYKNIFYLVYILNTIRFKISKQDHKGALLSEAVIYFYFAECIR